MTVNYSHYIEFVVILFQKVQRKTTIDSYDKHDYSSLFHYIRHAQVMNVLSGVEICETKCNPCNTQI